MNIETIKTEQTTEILSFIKKRWSPREFDPEKRISQNDLALLFEAARWAPSSRNEQPWSFIVITRDDPEQFNKMIDLLMDGNKSWASTAFALVLTVTTQQFLYNGSNNFHAQYDLGSSVANLILQATELNIYAHQMGGFYQDKAKKVFHLDKNHEPISILALGYLPENESFETRKQEQFVNRKRKVVNDFVYKNDWGNPLFELTETNKN